MGACPPSVTASFCHGPVGVLYSVSIFCLWTPLGTSVPQTPWFVPLLVNFWLRPCIETSEMWTWCIVCCCAVWRTLDRWRRTGCFTSSAMSISSTSAPAKNRHMSGPSGTLRVLRLAACYQGHSAILI